MFKRNKLFDELIIQIQKDKTIIEKLDYNQLDMFVQYLIELNKFLKESKGD